MDVTVTGIPVSCIAQWNDNGTKAMKRCIFIILCIFIVMQPVHGLASGLWSSSGLEMAIDGKNIVREFPDGSVSIRETDGGLMVTYMKNEILSDVVFLPIMTEIIWSPYGGSFVVSGSDGGSVGTWRSLYYFTNSDGSINSINIENIISSDLRDFPKCDDVETANFGAVRARLETL